MCKSIVAVKALKKIEELREEIRKSSQTAYLEKAEMQKWAAKGDIAKTLHHALKAEAWFDSIKPIEKELNDLMQIVGNGTEEKR